MARKYSSESSDSEKRNAHKRDDKRGERLRDDKDRDRANGSKDLLDSDKRSRKQHGRRDEHNGFDKDRERVNEKDVRDGDGRSRSEHVGRKQSRQSSDEDGEWVERDRSRQERERTHRHEGNRRREIGELDKVKESYPSSDEYDRRFEREKQERKRSRRHEGGHRQRETEGASRKKDRHARHDSEDDDDRKARRTSERQKDNTEQQKDSQNLRSKDGRDGQVLEESKLQRQPRLQEGNMNADASNLGKSGGVYIPPFKLARMMKEVEDKSSVEYQRLTWDALRKSINGLVNKVNAANIKNIIPELFSENLIRGRGLFCRSCMKSQMSSPGFTDVFAALVAVVNTKFPEVGDLLLRRIILQLKRAYKRNDKPQLLAAVKFIAHLVNQQVAHEIIALELLTVLLENPTDDSVEVAVGFVTECGSILQDLSPKGLHGIFERFRGILHEGEIDKRVQFLIEGLFAVRKAKFQGYPAVRPDLDLVEQEDQLTHEVSLQDEIDPEITLDIFKADPNFLENERRYEEVRKTILGEDSEDEAGSDAGSDDDEDDDDDEESDEEDEQQMKIKDETETNLVNLRRTIYLTIMSSVDFEEAGHKLLKIKLEPGQEMELCIMLLECCSQERTYLRYYGLLGQRFCMINKVHQENFEKCFVQQYSMIHRLETNKLRNVAKFFAHLLGTDALPWHVLAYIRLTEEDTTSSSRIFIKILFQELSEHLGIRLLNERLSEPTMQDSFESIFPRDNPKNTRFSINFFTSIGLGGITENLREYLKNMPRLIMQQEQAVSDSESDGESDSSDNSDTETASSKTESDSSSEESEKDDDRRRKRRRK
ncbi:pre-mRNA-splicing factor CWC22 homolog [Juglans microcarpa x Juglans regia]|uniref:pre-mRNA-splicing factor CWC22 homolog n=1 Tax=Juglans microcarpa x Juglans regia TaxID=2249226 RepID=UPI001B7E12E0|nr:pre-mRNA-splicing factor CWC22 homolog [Juglans microcarpa x Juglans regia]